MPPEVGAIVVKALESAGDVVRESSNELRENRDELRPHVSVNEWPYSALSIRAPRTAPTRCVSSPRRFSRLAPKKSNRRRAADRFQVVVHVDQAVLAAPAAAAESEPHRSELDAGPALALATVRRLGCDGTLVGILEGRDGEPLNIGRKTRAIPPAIMRALRARDGGCRFPGCDRTRFCEGHHVKHWANGGETKLGNLVTLCCFHHTLVHEGGFGVTATDDGVFVFTRPDGRRIPESGPRPAIDGTIDSAERFRGIVGADRSGLDRFRGIVASAPPMGDAGLAAFEEALRFHTQRLNPDPELKIDAGTSRCQWLGERMDYSMAIEGMQFREEAAAKSGDGRRGAELRRASRSARTVPLRRPSAERTSRSALTPPGAPSPARSTSPSSAPTAARSSRRNPRRPA